LNAIAAYPLNELGRVIFASKGSETILAAIDTAQFKNFMQAHVYEGSNCSDWPFDFTRGMIFNISISDLFKVPVF
jgi:hypothetical protein